MRKLTSRAPMASASSAATTSTAATGGAASTAASKEFRFSGDCSVRRISARLRRRLARNAVPRPPAVGLGAPILGARPKPEDHARRDPQQPSENSRDEDDPEQRLARRAE